MVAMGGGQGGGFWLELSAMKTQALIFDFDGTLAELNLDFTAITAEVMGLARAHGLAGDWPAAYLLEAIERVDLILGDGFGRRAHQLLETREVQAAERGSLFPYTVPMLARCRELGVKTAIISRNCGAAISVVFPEIERRCDVFLPRDKVKRTKPDPAHVHRALEGLGAAAAEAVMVGDHPMDVQTGLAAGCRTVGVASGRIGQGELAEAGADLVLPDAGGLLEALGIEAGGAG